MIDRRGGVVATIGCCFFRWCLFHRLLVMQITAATPAAAGQQELLKWQSRFWKHLQQERAGLWVYNQETDERVDQFRNVETCVQDSISAETFPSYSEPNPVIVNQVWDDEELPILMEIESAFTEYHAASVSALATCVATYIPDYHIHRSFSGDGGNVVTFVGVLISLFLPEVATIVQNTAELAYHTANWSDNNNNNDYPEPRNCGLRTSELLDYRDYKYLGSHTDSGSIYTVLFALSSDYEGGEFYILDGSKQKHHFKPSKYSALVFLSESKHGVTAIKSGSRIMFTNEYWHLEDPPYPHCRPLTEEMELFVERQNHGGGSVDDTWPTKKETGEWLIENGRDGMVDGFYQGNEYYLSVKRNEEEDDDDDDYYEEDNDDYYEDDDDDYYGALVDKGRTHLKEQIDDGEF